MDSQSQLERILSLCKENNNILKGMRSQTRWSGFFKFIYYVFIIGSMIGAYYYVQPLLQPFIESYENLINNIDQVKQTLPSADSLKMGTEKLNEVKDFINIQ